MEPHFEIKTSFDDNSLVLWARGELDLGGRQLVVDAAAPGFVQGQNVILDLSGLTFIDASGIRALVACANAAACARTRFAVRQASGQVARVITMTGLADLMVGQPAETPARASRLDTSPDLTAAPHRITRHHASQPRGKNRSEGLSRFNPH